MTVSKTQTRKNTLEENLHLDRAHSVLGPGAQFEGKLYFQGAVRIDGFFRGDIKTDDLLVIGPSADVEGTLEVGTLVVNGVFKGEVWAEVAVEMQRSARISANITTPCMSMEPGACFDGQCHVAPSSEQMNKEALNQDSEIVGANTFKSEHTEGVSEPEPPRFLEPTQE